MTIGEIEGAFVAGNLNIIWGADGNWELCSPQNISNLPPDTISVKVRLRPKSEARAYVKTKYSITQYVLELRGGKVVLGFAQSRNLRVKINHKPYDTFPHREGLPVMD